MGLWLWLAIAAGLPASVSGVTATTLWFSGTGFLDTIHPDTLYEDAGDLDIYIGGANTFTGILEVDLTNIPPPGSTVISATLLLPYATGPGFAGQDVTLMPTGAIFNITECTYNSAATGVPWDPPGEPITAEAVTTQITTSSMVSLSVNPDTIQRWIDGTGAGTAGFVITTPGTSTHVLSKTGAQLSLELADTTGSTAASTAGSTVVVTTTTTTTTAPSKKSSINLGLVIGATVGGIAGAIGIAAAVTYFRGSQRVKYARLHSKHHHSKHHHSKHSTVRT